MATGWLLLMALAVSGGEQGDLRSFGNKWGWSGTGEAFVPQLVMYRTPPHFYANPGRVERDIRVFLGEHGFDGFHVFLACRWFDISESDCRKARGEDPPLDPRTFEALAMLIERTHRAGGMVHLWAWGDEERGQTPGAPPGWGGLSGPVARKVEREIARRLGPLPGWSMGYGFDLDEWVSAAEIHAWRDRLQGLLPSFRFLGGRPGGPNHPPLRGRALGRGHARYERWNRGLDYASYEHHKPSYAVYVDALAASPSKPVMSEDRFRVLASSDEKHYRLEEVRRGLWHSALAGGVANIWGYLMEGGTHELGSAPFPNRDEIRTYSDFIRGRFSKEMEPCSPADADPKRISLCLAVPGGRQAVLYKEEAIRVELGLGDAPASLPAVAVDAKRPYAEIDLGAIDPRAPFWSAPHRSDWAIALGDFDRGPRRAVPPSTSGASGPVAPGAPSELEIVAGSGERVVLSGSTTRPAKEASRSRGPRGIPACRGRFVPSSSWPGTSRASRTKGSGPGGPTGTGSAP